MKVTIDIKDELYKDLKSFSEITNSTISDEIEKAVSLMLKKRALIKKLMAETCHEYDDAMQRLAS